MNAPSNAAPHPEPRTDGPGPLVRALLERTGLVALFDARMAGDVDAARAARATLESADLFALGAFADAIRAREVGPVVRIHAGSPAGALVLGKLGQDGLSLLREVAIARVTSAPGTRLCVDFVATGMEIAEVALAFGASELVGPTLNKRGLAIADDATRKVKGQGMVSEALLKQKDIARVLAASGREVSFEGAAR